MKNVTISLSEDLVHILDSICKDCNLSRYAFTKEASLEKIERHTKSEVKEEWDKTNRENSGKASEQNTSEDNDRVLSPFLSS